MSTNEPTSKPCQPPRHYFNVDAKGNIALRCKCGVKIRKVAK